MKDLKELKGAIGCSLTSPKEDYSKYGLLKDVETITISDKFSPDARRNTKEIVKYCIMFFEHNVVRIRESLLPQIQIVMEDIPVLSDEDFKLYF